jgi:hypothetical protein
VLAKPTALLGRRGQFAKRNRRRPDPQLGPDSPRPLGSASRARGTHKEHIRAGTGPKRSDRSSR